MKRISVMSVVAAGLALLSATGAFAALNPAAPNPYPERQSKLLVDFTSPVTVTSDPLNTGGNVATLNTDPQFTALGTKSLKLDLNGVNGWTAPEYTLNLAAPVDIKGYQVLAMDVFIPDASINTSSWYQFDPVVTTTNATDSTMTTDTFYGPGNMHNGWNHLMWTLKNGTDTQITKVAVDGNSGDAYSGAVYVDNIRVYKGSFAGLQPDEKLIMGFDKATDASFFDTVTDPVKVSINTDKQFISDGTSSLKLDLTGWSSGWSNNVASASNWGTTIDASKATALHLDFYVPSNSYKSTDYHEIGYAVTGDGGTVSGFSEFVTNDQWVTIEIPLTTGQAAMLKNVQGMGFIVNSGSNWDGPVYVDALRAVFPTTAPATAGQ